MLLGYDIRKEQAHELGAGGSLGKINKWAHGEEEKIGPTWSTGAVMRERDEGRGSRQSRLSPRARRKKGERERFGAFG